MYSIGLFKRTLLQLQIIGQSAIKTCLLVHKWLKEKLNRTLTIGNNYPMI